ncbi:Alpha/Beta hydrolase protein [Ilyonectria sp. MPI-CAGE-AT-0026]|nr:Alpha/Beta hydrolase protein [Ilyonectria sp. MPI-CAGE-AT-0026]
MDFSRYAETAPEWSLLLEQNPGAPEIGFDLGSDPIQLRSQANAQRETMSLSLYNKMGLDKAVRYTDHVVSTHDGQTISLRAYRPATLPENQAAPALVYYHGGGMLIGSLDGELLLTALLSKILGLPVIHVCYRHTPEHKHPSQHNDAWSGLEWVLTHGKELGIDPSQVSVGGASAGATLAASVTLAETQLAHKESRAQRIKGQVLVIPWLVTHEQFPFELIAGREKCSRVQNADQATLPSSRLDLFTQLYAAADPNDQYNNFLFAEDHILGALPKTAIIVHGKDVLRDEGLLYAQRLEGLGVPTKVHVFQGLPHAFRLFNDLPQSKRWDALFAESVLWTLDKNNSGTLKDQWVIEK